MQSRWNFDLAAWIIQDGNYPDFSAGQIAEFAVEFYQRPNVTVVPCSSRTDATLLTGTTYQVTGQRVFAKGNATVLDIGFLVYREGPSELAEMPIGQFFLTELELGIDPYFYLERLSQDSDIPPLVYTWRITSILQQTAPFVEAVPDSGLFAGRKMQVRDPSKLGYKPILRTDAWRDDEGFAEYILCCDLLENTPTRVSATAT